MCAATVRVVILHLLFCERISARHDLVWGLCGVERAAGVYNVSQRVRWTLSSFEHLCVPSLVLLVRWRDSHRSLGLLMTWLHNSRGRAVKVVRILFRIARLQAVRGISPQTR